jgi:hypothetical protein
VPGGVQGQQGAQVPTSMSGVVMSPGGPVGGMQMPGQVRDWS